MARDGVHSRLQGLHTGPAPDAPRTVVMTRGPGWLRVVEVGFWAEAEGPSEWPHPRDLVTRWDPAERQRAVAYLKRGGAVAAYFGIARCRLCASSVGSMDLWDGTYLWPQGLDHYVTAHDIALPDFFLRHLASEPEPPPPVDLTAPPALVRSGSEFKRWAAAAAASPAPRPGAMSLPQAQARAAWLSTPVGSFAVDAFCGRWHVKGAGLEAYVAPLAAEEFDLFLSGYRRVAAPIASAEATELAARLAGDDLVVTCAPCETHAPFFHWTVEVRDASRRHEWEERATDAAGVELLVAQARQHLARYGRRAAPSDPVTGEAAEAPTHAPRADARPERYEAVCVPLDTREDGLHFARVEGAVLSRADHVLLAVRSHLGRGMAPEEVDPIYKLASWGEIAEVVQTADPGVRMWPLTHAPAPVVHREDTLYFHLQRDGEHWRSVAEEGTIAFYLAPPYHPPAVSVELWALER